MAFKDRVCLYSLAGDGTLYWIVHTDTPVTFFSFFVAFALAIRMPGLLML